MENNHDFSPYQLTIGMNPIMLNLNAKFPALESQTTSDFVAEQPQLMNQAESSVRHRRVLKHNVQTYTEVEIVIGCIFIEMILIVGIEKAIVMYIQGKVMHLIYGGREVKVDLS